MIFLIIGHSVVDKIIDKSKLSKKPGGIYYSVISILSQLGKNDKLFLCSAIDERSKSLFKEIYDQVDKKYLQNVDSIPEVELVIEETGERKEKYSAIPGNLILPMDDLNQFDGILMNMISGYDISLTQLQQIRKNFSGLIYFDVHTLSRGVDEGLKRNFRLIENFNKWAACIDILQTNERELLTLSKKNAEMDIIEELLVSGIKQIIITRAEKGASVYLKENDVIIKYHEDAIKVKLINKVGCGDVFGAVYFYDIIKNKNVTLALKNANLCAGISTTYLNTKDYLNLKKDADKQLGKK
jgi:sugar/nucleoside kinase (ribokinase family)